MREYRLRIPSGLAWVLSVRAALYRSATCRAKAKDGCMRSGAWHGQCGRHSGVLGRRRARPPRGAGRGPGAGMRRCCRRLVSRWAASGEGGAASTSVGGQAWTGWCWWWSAVMGAWVCPALGLGADLPRGRRGRGSHTLGSRTYAPCGCGPPARPRGRCPWCRKSPDEVSPKL